MSQATVKQVRRDLRRAVGEDALATIGEAQTNIERLANSAARAHQRIDTVEQRQSASDANLYGPICDRLDAMQAFASQTARDQMLFLHRTLYHRLLWLLTGR